jgi:hypothetical protein
VGRDLAAARPGRVGLLVTLLVGRPRSPRLTLRLSRNRIGFGRGLAGGAFAWAQAWAVYAVLQSPDVFLGGVT